MEIMNNSPRAIAFKIFQLFPPAFSPIRSKKYNCRGSTMQGYRIWNTIQSHFTYL